MLVGRNMAMYPTPPTLSLSKGEPVVLRQAQHERYFVVRGPARHEGYHPWFKGLSQSGVPLTLSLSKGELAAALLATVRTLSDRRGCAR